MSTISMKFATRLIVAALSMTAMLVSCQGGGGRFLDYRGVLGQVRRRHVQRHDRCGASQPPDRIRDPAPREVDCRRERLRAEAIRRHRRSAPYSESRWRSLRLRGWRRRQVTRGGGWSGRANLRYCSFSQSQIQPRWETRSVRRPSAVESGWSLWETSKGMGSRESRTTRYLLRL